MVQYMSWLAGELAGWLAVVRSTGTPGSTAYSRQGGPGQGSPSAFPQRYLSRYSSTYGAPVEMHEQGTTRRLTATLVSPGPCLHMRCRCGKPGRSGRRTTQNPAPRYDTVTRQIGVEAATAHG